MFRFDFAKTLQAAAVLLRHEPGRRTNYMRLIKLVYIADREALAETGHPITGSKAIAMKRGPLPQKLYELIKGEHYNSPAWENHVDKERYTLSLAKDPGMGALSSYEIVKLLEIASRYRDCDEWDMVRITYEFPEWRKNDPGDSSREIPVADILDAQGKADRLQEVEQSARDEVNISGFFDIIRSAGAAG